MTFIDMLRDASTRNDSMLCVGLDPEPSRFPGAMQGDASKIYDFCAAIVDATHDLVNSFKPQIAYFAAHRAEDQLEKLMEHMRRVAPHVPVILDAKRGDIGSTAEQYAKEAFERYGADAVTLSPFMGFDSITPYLKYEGKGAFCCAAPPTPAVTICRPRSWPMCPATPICSSMWPSWPRAPGTPTASWAWWWAQPVPTRSSACVPWPHLPLLIPGVGTGRRCRGNRQGGPHRRRPIIINSSRAILYAGQGDDFAKAAREAAIATRATLQAAAQS
jgi:orotidine-5'-phosphate decarboxylase